MVKRLRRLVNLSMKRRGMRSRAGTIAARRRIGGPRGYADKIYRYVQHVDGSTISVCSSGNKIITQTAAFQFSGIIVSLNDLPQAAIYTALYDEYRIKKVVLKFMPMTNGQSIINSTYSTVTGSGVVGAANNPGLFHTITDLDGSTPSTLAGYEQYQTYKNYRVMSGRIIKLTYYPGVLFASQIAGGSNSANSVKVSPWIDCGTPNVNHYCGAWALDSYGTQGSSSAQIFQVSAIYHLEFKNVR